MSIVLRVAIIAMLLAANYAPRSPQLIIPLRPALSHENHMGNQIMAPPSPPPWTLFFPWPEAIPPNSDFDELRRKHKSQMDMFKLQQETLLERSIALATHLPDEHLLHALLLTGTRDCELGNCQIWIQINQNTEPQPPFED